jgi:hypothetical protein
VKRAYGLMLLLLIGTAQADPLGRLFLTPAQRQVLDSERRALSSKPAGGGDEPVATVQLPRYIRFNGLVERSDGLDAAWVNDASTLKGEVLPDRLRVEIRHLRDGRIRLRLPDGHRVYLKPGQVYDRDSGKVLEGYQVPASTPAAPVATAGAEAAAKKQSPPLVPPQKDGGP